MAPGLDTGPIEALIVSIENLLNTLKDQSPVKRRSSRSNKSSDPAPVIFLSFDEAHFLSKTPLEPAGNTNLLMAELRRILNLIKTLPIFVLFLSTTGKISNLVSSHCPDVSRRLREGTMQLIPAFSDLGYDHLAHNNKIGVGTHSLANVVEHGFMANFGRPLYVFPFISLNVKIKNYQ